MPLSEEEVQMLKEAQERAKEKMEKKTPMPISSSPEIHKRIEKPASKTCQCGANIEPTCRGFDEVIFWYPPEEHCERCREEELKRKDEDREKEAKETRTREKERRKVWRAEHIEEILTKAGVPRRYLNCTFENFKEEPGNRAALLGARDYLSGEATGLFLFGSPGTGKTHLACGIVRELLLKDEEITFKTATCLVMELRECSMDDEPSKLSAFIDELCSIKHLIIDDLGSEKVTEFVKQSLYTIVNERDGEMLPMILTSNLSLKELAERLDPRLASRLAGSCRIIRLSGQDWRLKRHK